MKERIDFLDSHLIEFARIYQESINAIRNIEDKAAISALNYSFFNNMKHSLEHLTAAIIHASSKPQARNKSEDHIYSAISDLNNLTIDAHEYIAGMKLDETKRHMMKGISLSERKKAKELFAQAVFHYTEGRNKRAANPHEANEHFTKTVELCIEGMLSVKPITTRQWITLLLMFLSILVGLSGWAMFLAKVFNLF